MNGRQTASAHLYRFYVSLSIILVLLAWVVVPTNGGDQNPAKDSARAARKVVYQVYEKHMVILEEVATTAKDKEILDEAKRKEVRNALAGIDSSLFPGEEKKDLEAWRDLLVAFLDKVPDSGFDRGYHSWEPLRKCMAVLANHDITGAVAKEDGYPQFAEKIDALHDMAKAILLIQCGQNPKALQEVFPLTRAFIEYFYIYTALVGSKNRDPIAQCALLSMKPGETTEEAIKAPFFDLHKSLLSLSHRAHGKPELISEGSGIEGKQPLVFLCDIVKKGAIQESEIEKAKVDEKLLAIVKQFREIARRGQPCGSVIYRRVY